MTTKYVVIASGATWTVPSDYGTLVSIEALGGGQAGQGESGAGHWHRRQGRLLL